MCEAKKQDRKINKTVNISVKIRLSKFGKILADE